MSEVLDFTYSDPSIALTVRPTRSGPESSLTEAFLDVTVSHIRKQTRHYAVFCEPQIDTGFPDIVIAKYNPRVFADWKPDRCGISTQDLKLLHHLHFTRGGDAEDIESQLGIASKPLLRSLERLMSADLVRWHGRKWMPRSLRKAFAVTSLVAIEAKMKNWASAFMQAELNRWFASETYVLSPIARPQKQIVQSSEQAGIGIYSMPTDANATRIVHARKESIPASFASWQFNEWIGRRIYSLKRTK